MVEKHLKNGTSLKLKHKQIKSVTSKLHILKHISKRNCALLPYDAVSDVVESGVHWRSDFQIGPRVLKVCFHPILMHIYGCLLYTSPSPRDRG